MSSINFNNPYLLLVLIPLLASVIVPFALAIKKHNLNGYVITSLVCHVLMSVLATMTFSGTTYERVITETNVYVLADVSYSSDQNLELVDTYIKDLNRNLPKNSKLGIVCFGKDYEVLVDLGEDIKSVKESTVDNTETNISSALEYTASLFNRDAIKRIVIISDGKETNSSSIISVVDSLYEDNVYVDAIFLDDNLKDVDKEVQMNDIEYTESTFINKEEKLNVMIQSSYEVKGYVYLLRDGVEKTKKSVSLIKGFNTVSFDLDTTTAGTFEYTVRVEVEEDYCSDNNEMKFIQRLSDEVRTLFLSGNYDDQDMILKLFDTNNPKQQVDFFFNTSKGIPQNVKDNDMKLPLTVEELCVYDQFIFSSIDFREVLASGQFLDSVDTCVSEFGKTLVTLGDTYIASDDTEGGNELLDKYQDMLPVKFGNRDGERKLITIILDISKSMMNYSRVFICKRSACQIVDLLDEKDIVTVVTFAGTTKVLQHPIEVGPNRDTIKENINAMPAEQGTFLSTALQDSLKMIKDLPYENKETFLISDGLPYTGGTVTEETIKNVAKEYSQEGVSLTTINASCPDGEALLKELANFGNGSYFRINTEEEVDKVVLQEISNEIKDLIVEGASYQVSKVRANADVFNGVGDFEKLRGFYLVKKKSNAINLALVSYSKTGDENFIDSPLYTYWNYGQGKAYTFASDISNALTWGINWRDSTTNGYKFLQNIIPTTIPDVKQSSPFVFGVDIDGTTANISVKAPSVSASSVLTLNVKYPDATTKEVVLAFDTENYVTTIETSQVGKYELELKYTRGNLEYNATKEIYISYPEEYNRFEHYDASNLHYMVSQDGIVSTDGKLKLENNNVKVTTYVYDFTIAFMSAMACLFVVDVFARKVKWADIKALFGKKKK